MKQRDTGDPDSLRDSLQEQEGLGDWLTFTLDKTENSVKCFKFMKQSIKGAGKEERKVECTYNVKE